MKIKPSKSFFILFIIAFIIIISAMIFFHLVQLNDNNVMRLVIGNNKPIAKDISHSEPTRPMYETLLSEIQTMIPDTVQAIDGRVLIYNDSLLASEPVYVKTDEPIIVLKKLLEGLTPTDTLDEYSILLKVSIHTKSSSTNIGWLHAEDVIPSPRKLSSTFSTAQGVIGVQYAYEPAPWHRPINCLWLKAGDSILAFADICDYWSSPDNRYFMTCGKGIDIVNSRGITIYKNNVLFTSPGWLGDSVLVRGMYDDDAVYVINLKVQACTLFFKVPSPYSKRNPDYGSGDGYFAYPAPAIDAKAGTVSIRFDRHLDDVKTNTYLLATTDLKGKLIRIEEKTDPQ